MLFFNQASPPLKRKIYLGYDDFVGIFWGHHNHKIGLYKEVISMYFRVFS